MKKRINFIIQFKFSLFNYIVNINLFFVVIVLYNFVGFILETYLYGYYWLENLSFKQLVYQANLQKLRNYLYDQRFKWSYKVLLPFYKMGSIFQNFSLTPWCRKANQSLIGILAGQTGYLHLDFSGLKLVCLIELTRDIGKGVRYDSFPHVAL